MSGTSKLARLVPLAVALALLSSAGSPAAVGHASKKKKKTVRVHRSTAAQLVVPRGRPVEIAFANDPSVDTIDSSANSKSIVNAVQMAVEAHPSIRGFPIQINVVNALTCGNPASAGSAAVTAANTITGNTQNVAVLGHICSFGFAQALPIYESAGVVVITGSATNRSLPSAAPTVFNRTTVDDDGFDGWYASVSALPSDVAWRQAYDRRFGAAPGDFADLYYDAASLLIRDLQQVSAVDNGQELVISRDDLAAAIRATTSYRGVSCTVAIDASTGNRIDDAAALSRCAADTG